MHIAVGVLNALRCLRRKDICCLRKAESPVAMPKAKAKAGKKSVAQSVEMVKETAAVGRALSQPTDLNPEDDLTSSSSKVAIECNAIVKTFVQGARCVAPNAG